MRISDRKWQGVVLIAFMGLGVANEASARAIRIDEGNAISDTNPSFWTSPPTSISPVVASTLVDIGFTVNFGQTAGIDGSKMTIYSNGYVSFGADPVALTTSIVTPVVAPFLMTSPVDSLEYTTGRVDLSGPPYSDVGAVDAFRVSWFVGTDDKFPFQVVLFDMSDITLVAGDFDMEINYGYEFQPTAPTPYSSLVAAGFQLGTNSAVLNTNPNADPNPFDASANHFYSFRSGVLVESETLPPTSVPEPDSLALLVAGLALFGVTAARRRQTAPLS